MKIFLARVVPDDASSCVPAFRSLIAGQRAQRHEVVDDPDMADVILFTECHLIDEWNLRAVTSHELTRRHPQRAFVYNERDHPWCALPGIYVSMPRRSSTVWTVAGSYYVNRNPCAGRPPAAITDADLLFSFIGSPTARCREQIYRLRDARAVLERVDGFLFFDAASTDFAFRTARYAELVSRSKFVLCPRGAGTSSIRLYEVCGAGRVPVIIADDWVPPTGPDWASFSVRWPEAAVARLPAHLAAIEPRAAAMGQRARRAFDTWFAPDVALTHQLDRLEDLRAVRSQRAFRPAGMRDADWREAARGRLARTVRQRLSPVKHAVTDPAGR